MSRLLELVLLRPGPPQEAVLAHLPAVQDRLNLAAACKALHQASSSWFAQVIVGVSLWTHGLWRLRRWSLGSVNLHPGSPQFESLLAWLARYQARANFEFRDKDDQRSHLGSLPSAATAALVLADITSSSVLPLSSITRLTALTKLSMGDSAMAGSLEQLWQLTRLQELHVALADEGASTQLSGSLQGLTCLSQLQRLGLYNTGQPLPALPQLTSLHVLTCAGWPDDGWAFLPQLTRLEDLDVNSCSAHDITAALPHLTRLTRLECSLWGYEESDGEEEEAEAAGEEAEAEADPWRGWQALSHLQRLQSLELRDLGRWQLPPGISTLTCLTQVNLSYIQLEGDGGWQHLAPLTGLRQIRLECVGGGGSAQRTLDALPPLPQLDSLWLMQCGLERVPASVALQTALTALSLSNNPRLVAGWEHLRPLSRLEKLGLALFRGLTPELTAMPDLSALTALTELSLAGQTALEFE